MIPFHFFFLFKNHEGWIKIKQLGSDDEIKDKSAALISSVPISNCKMAALLVLSAGCNKLPITIAGFIVTISKALSFTNFHAASSANVFESTYQSW